MAQAMQVGLLHHGSSFEQRNKLNYQASRERFRDDANVEKAAAEPFVINIFQINKDIL